MIINFLKLIRWPNVFITIVTQLVVIYAVLEPTGIELALASWQRFLLILSTALITASGNVINDVYDMETDAINKPAQVIVGRGISEKKAFRIYLILTTAAVVSGFILANSVHLPIMSISFILVSFILYSYASSLKGGFLVGNILISLLVGLVVILTGLFELYPALTVYNQSAVVSMMSILLDFAIMATAINLIREWIKDAQDLDGDHQVGHKTIAIILGRNRTARVCSIATAVLLIAIGWYVYTYLINNAIALYYFVFLIMAPLMFVMLKSWSAREKKDFKLLSIVLKIVLATGMLSMGIFNL